MSFLNGGEGTSRLTPATRVIICIWAWASLPSGRPRITTPCDINITYKVGFYKGMDGWEWREGGSGLEGFVD